VGIRGKSVRHGRREEIEVSRRYVVGFWGVKEKGRSG